MKHLKSILGIFLFSQFAFATSSIYTNTSIMHDSDVRFVIVKDGKAVDDVARGPIDNGINGATTPSDFTSDASSGDATSVSTTGVASLTPDVTTIGKAQLNMQYDVVIEEGDTGNVTATSDKPLAANVGFRCILKNATTATNGADIVSVNGAGNGQDGQTVYFTMLKNKTTAGFAIVTKEDTTIEEDESVTFDCKIWNGSSYGFENTVAQLKNSESDVVVKNDDFAYPATKTTQKIESFYWWCDSCNFKSGIVNALNPLLSHVGASSASYSNYSLWNRPTFCRFTSCNNWTITTLNGFIALNYSDKPIYIRSDHRPTITWDPGTVISLGHQILVNEKDQWVAGDEDKPSLFFWTFGDVWTCNAGDTLFLQGTTWMCRQ